MKEQDAPPPPHSLALDPGAQAVINGAIVTATNPCVFEVGSGSYVLTGQDLSRSASPMSHPHDELYFSMIEAATSPERFHEARFRLFNLLGQVVAQSRSHAAQKECSVCAAAMMAGDAKAAMASAARLSAERIDYEAGLDRRDALPIARRAERRLPRRPLR